MSTPSRKGKRSSSRSATKVSSKATASASKSSKSHTTTTTTTRVMEVHANGSGSGAGAGAGRAHSVMTEDSMLRETRLEEREELRSLNSRLSTYVLHNKAIEDEVQVLQRQVAAESSRAEALELQVSNLEVENQTLRAQLKELPGLRKERSALVTQIQRMEHDHTKLVAEMEGEIRDLQARLKEQQEHGERLEEELREMRAALKDRNKLDKANTVLQRRVDSLEEEYERSIKALESAQSALDELRSSNTDRDSDLAEAEARLNVLEEEKLTLQSQVQELARSKKEAVAEERKAAQAKLQALRAEWKRDSDERAAKVEAELRHSFTASANGLRERSDQLTTQNKRLQSENDKMQGEITRAKELMQELMTRLSDMELRQKEEAEAWALETNRLEKEVSSLHAAHALKIDEFNDLMDVKITLQAEIDEYAALLGSEEARTGLPTPSRPTHASKRERAADSDSEHEGAGA